MYLAIFNGFVSSFLRNAISQIGPVNENIGFSIGYFNDPFGILFALVKMV
jgi:hypothetical protein